MQYLTDINLAKNSLNNARVQNLAADPSTPVVGQIYFNTATNRLRTFNGTTWDETGTSSGTGTVTSVSVVSANGLAGTVATATTTPAITLSTTVTGITKGNGTALSAAVAGTDYVIPSGSITGTSANVTGIVAVANGGTGSSTQNFVDLSTAQTVAGVKTFSASPVVPSPTGATDAANKSYVDSIAVGIDWKPSVRVATTVAGTLTTSFAAAQVVDGITLATNDRILIKDQAAPAENGIYVVTAGTPTRATDADTAAEVTAGLSVFVEEGTVNDNQGYTLTNNGAITLGTTGLTFTQFTGLGQVTAGTGLTKTGNSIALTTPVAVANGGTGVTTSTGTGANVLATSPTLVTPLLGTPTSGVATNLTGLPLTTGVTGTLPVANGGTNATTVAGAKTSLGFTTKFTGTIGDGTTTAIAVTHGLGSQFVTAQVYDATSNLEVKTDVTLTSATVTTFTFNTAPTANQYRVVIVG